MKSAKTAKAKHSATAVVAAAPSPRARLWPYAVGIFVSFYAVCYVYWPAVYGPWLAVV